MVGIDRGSIWRLSIFLLLVILMVAYISANLPEFYYKFFGQANNLWEPEVVSQGEPAGTAGDAQSSQPVIALQKQDFFIEYRLERERVRSQQIELLRELINNPRTDEETRKQATQQWLAISDRLGSELELENLIKAKGFDDALVFLQDTSATVIVKGQDLTTAEAARILEIVIKGAGLSPEAINIIAKDP